MITDITHALPAPTPEAIAALLAEAGLSLQATADALGIADRQTIARWKLGRNPPLLPVWALALLLAGQHPRYVLAARPAQAPGGPQAARSQAEA